MLRRLRKKSEEVEAEVAVAAEADTEEEELVGKGPAAVGCSGSP